MVEPIPREMLPHSGTLFALVKHGAKGPEYDTVGVTLDFVRFNTAKKTLAAALGEQKQDRLTMVFDCTNSEPIGTTFAQLDHIVFGGTTYSVREVVSAYAFDSDPHHYEVALA